MHLSKPALVALLMIATLQSHAAEPGTGPVIENFGPVYDVPPGSFSLDPAQHYKVVLDVGSGADEAGQANRGIETAARFLNMHVRNGIAAENLEFALVLHGAGARAALTPEAHARHFDGPNPNQEMLAALVDAGVDIYLGGQTAGYYGYTVEDLLPGIRMSLSAMTAHVRLQQEGYRAILF